MIENLNIPELRQLIKKATIRLQQLEIDEMKNPNFNLELGNIYVAYNGNEIEIVNKNNNIFYGKNKQTKITKEYYINGKQSRHKQFEDDIERKK
jgi:FtsZ-binding cell division protein ZapB